MFLNLAQKRLTTTFAIVSPWHTTLECCGILVVARFHFFLSDFGQVTPYSSPLLRKYAQGNEHLIATYCIRRQQFGDGLVVLLSFPVCVCSLCVIRVRTSLFFGQFRFTQKHTHTHKFTSTLVLAVVIVVVVVVPCGVCEKRFNYICMLKLQLTSAFPLCVSLKALLNFNRVVCSSKSICVYICGCVSECLCGRFRI